MGIEGKGLFVSRDEEVGNLSEDELACEMG